MKNKFKLSLIILCALFMMLMVSCQKENYDLSETTNEEITPEANYTGDDNLFSFALTTIIPNSSSTSGGSSVENNITKEVLANGEIKWKLFSSVTDGITVTNEITFITSNTDAGTYPIEEFHFIKLDDTGTTLEEYLWTSADLTGEIMVSGLEDSPGIVSGKTIDVSVIEIPGTLEYVYGANFSEIPIN
ncbi:MAG: hypothetical protein AB8F94_24150 [Saprospiraceae bacterium]